VTDASKRPVRRSRLVYRLEDLDPVAGGDRCLPAKVLPVDEHLAVAPDEPALVEDPAADRRLCQLERVQDFVDGRPADGVVRRAARAGLQRPVQRHDCHQLAFRDPERRADLSAVVR
jgi:hypothetical protein